MSIYSIKSIGNVEEYISINTDFSDIQRYCRKSEFQFLTHDKITVETDDSGGIEFPDLIVKGDVWLFSDFVVQAIRSDIETYAFMKPVEIVCDVLGKKEKYWLVIPPRIDCIDLDKSKLDYDWDFGFGIIPVLDSKKTIIDEKLIGYYHIFKVLGINDNGIYISENLAKRINNLNPEGIKIIKC